MSADANSAFGSRPRSHRAKGRQTDDRDSEGFPSHSLTPESPHPTASQRDNYPPNSTFSPTANAQTAPFNRAEWFEGAPTSQASVDSLLNKFQQQVSRSLADQVTPVRLASHLSVLIVAAVILIISQIEMPTWNVSLLAFPNSTLLGSGDLGQSIQSRAAALMTDQNSVAVSGNEALQRATVPFTVIHQAPKEEGIQTYTVQPGDTVLGIAEKFGLHPETVQWSNSTLELNPDLIRPGDQLNILPVNGVLHTVAPGDTLGSLANKYKVTVEDLLNYKGNGLADAATPLVIGQQLVVPNGTKPFASQQVVVYNSSSVPSTASKGSGAFVWPSSGSINQRYWSGHPAIDIGAWTGAPVKAADGGYVAVATGGWNGGYGNHVIVDHGNGFATLYAHLNSIYVRAGENVTRGQQLGSVGNTGNSTGPHLHFEIRYQGVPRNPFSYLP